MIVFKAKDYDDICDEYASQMEMYRDSVWTKPQNGNIYSVFQYRIVIPSLHISLREGEWYSVDADYSEEDDDEIDWDEYYQGSMYLVYSEDEKNINSYQCAVGPWLSDAIQDACLACNISSNEADELECYIDFDVLSEG